MSNNQEKQDSAIFAQCIAFFGIAYKHDGIFEIVDTSKSPYREDRFPVGEELEYEFIFNLPYMKAFKDHLQAIGDTTSLDRINFINEESEDDFSDVTWDDLVDAFVASH